MELLINPVTVHLEFGGMKNNLSLSADRWFKVIDDEGDEIGCLWLRFCGMSMKWCLAFDDHPGHFEADLRETKFAIPRGCKDINHYTIEFLIQFFAKFNLDLSIEGWPNEAV